MGRDQSRGKELGIDWFTTGDGFTWTSKDMDETIARALAWLGGRQRKKSPAAIMM